MTHQKRPNNKGKNPSKDKEIHKPNAPKDHLEVPSSEGNSFEKRKQEFTGLSIHELLRLVLQFLFSLLEAISLA